jgi:hypothetical protein
MLALKSTRLSQGGAQDVDLSNPLSNGAFVWSPFQPDRLIGARTVLMSSETAYLSSPIGRHGVGRQWTRSANAGVNFGLQQIITQNTGVTVLVVAAPRAASALKVPFSHRSAGGAFIQTELVFNSQDVAGIAGATASAVMLASYNSFGRAVVAQNQLDGQAHCWVTGNGATDGYIYRDGVEQTLSFSNRINFALTDSTARTRIGNIADDGGTTYPHDDPLFLVIVWNRLLTRPEAQSAALNPWQIFR